MTIENEKKGNNTSVLKSEYYSCYSSFLRNCKLRSVWALSATITMLSDISSAAMAGGSTMFSGASTRGNEAGM